MRRDFKVVGKIDENTPVLGTTYGQVREAMRAGFEEQFEMIDRGQRVDELHKQTAAAHRMFDRLSEQAALLRDQATQLEVIREQAAQLDMFMKQSVQPEGWPAAYIDPLTSVTIDWAQPSHNGNNVAIGGAASSLRILEAGGVDVLVADITYQASMSGEHLVLKTGTHDQPPKTEHRRRAEDKELNR